MQMCRNNVVFGLGFAVGAEGLGGGEIDGTYGDNYLVLVYISRCIVDAYIFINFKSLILR
jgi:hypothetical protein